MENHWQGVVVYLSFERCRYHAAHVHHTDSDYICVDIPRRMRIAFTATEHGNKNIIERPGRALTPGSCRPPMSPTLPGPKLCQFRVLFEATRGRWLDDVIAFLVTCTRHAIYLLPFQIGD